MIPYEDSMRWACPHDSETAEERAEREDAEAERADHDLHRQRDIEP